LNFTNLLLSRCESKFIHEPIIENAFLEAFKLLSENFDDVLDSMMETLEDVACDDTDVKQKKKIDRDIFVTEGKRKKLTDMLLDDLISKEAYDEKYNDLVLDLHKSIDKRTILESNIGEQKILVSVWQDSERHWKRMKFWMSLTV